MSTAIRKLANRVSKVAVRVQHKAYTVETEEHTIDFLSRSRAEVVCAIGKRHNKMNEWESGRERKRCENAWYFSSYHIGTAMHASACLLVDVSLSHVSYRVAFCCIALCVYLFVYNCESKVFGNGVCVCAFSVWNDAFVNEEHPFTHLHSI